MSRPPIKYQELITVATKKCNRCSQDKTTSHFIGVNSKIHGAALPVCKECLNEIIENNLDQSEINRTKDWNIVNKICQWADVPFVPGEWEKIKEGHKDDAIGVYMSIYRNSPYDTLDWQMYNDVYLTLKEEERVEDAIPFIKEQQERKLRQKWGLNYDQQDLEYLENLHQGLISSQNIVGALNEDQALKLCKISLIIEQKIREGEDFDKDLKAYDQLSKLANLTPKVIKDAHEFNSVGEIFAYLEKLGWVNQYYDGTIRDEADYTAKDIKYWLQYLYVHETGVAEEIEQRINNLQLAAQLTGSKFDKKEFMDYMEQQGSVGMEEEFEIEV